MGRWTSNVIRGAMDHETHGSDRFTVFESQIGFFFGSANKQTKMGAGEWAETKVTLLSTY